MTVISRFLQSFAAGESGATAIEYSLIAALVSFAIIAALQLVSGAMTGLYTLIAGALGV